MLNIDLYADGELGRRAIETVTAYIENIPQSYKYKKEDEWPIRRTQIAGLRQIAANEPAKLSEFAEHQQRKAQAKLEKVQKGRNQLESVVAFWTLVKALCVGGPANRVPWSLAKMREECMPEELKEEKLPPGAKPTPEQQTERKDKQRRRKEWQAEWDREFFGVFFQRFCIHYLYEMSNRTRGQ